MKTKRIFAYGFLAALLSLALVACPGAIRPSNDPSNGGADGSPDGSNGSNNGGGSGAITRPDRPRPPGAAGPNTPGGGAANGDEWSITTLGDVGTIGPPNGGSGGPGGPVDPDAPTFAPFAPWGVAVRAVAPLASEFFVTDSNNHWVRRVTLPQGAFSTLAGRGAVPGFASGTGADAQFSHPLGMAMDADGNIFVADRDNHSIRWITPAGVVTTIAGPDYPPEPTDPTDPDLDDDPDGNGTYAGNGTPGANGTYAGNGTGNGTAPDPIPVDFDRPSGVAVDALGNIFVADTGNHRIRMITPAGVVSTLAGGTQGLADGSGESARFNSPAGVAVDALGNVFVADTGNHRIRMITADGEVSTVEGGAPASADLGLDRPSGLVVDVAGNIFIADTGNHRIVMITEDGEVVTIAGESGVSGTANGIGDAARFNEPFGIAMDYHGRLFVTDTGNRSIRIITQVATP